MPNQVTSQQHSVAQLKINKEKLIIRLVNPKDLSIGFKFDVNPNLQVKPSEGYIKPRDFINIEVINNEKTNLLTDCLTLSYWFVQVISNDLRSQQKHVVPIFLIKEEAQPSLLGKWALALRSIILIGLISYNIRLIWTINWRNQLNLV